MDTVGRIRCPYENLEDSDYCIYHLKDDEKDIELFNRGIEDIFEAEENIFIEGFYFPPGTTDFSAKIFRKKVDFANVIFSGGADFSGTKFLDDAIFAGAIFSGDAFFDYATFAEMAQFMEVTFSGGSDFTGTIFTGKAYFTEIIFEKTTVFIDAIFSNKVLFKRVIFLKGTSFRRTEFVAVVHFDNVEINGRCVFLPIKSDRFIFDAVYFSDNVRLKADLSKSCFVNSNIERVDMTDSIWSQEDESEKSTSSPYKQLINKIGFTETSIVIWEEHEGELSSNWKELEGIYRRLKQSYQKYGDNSTAGKFYYQEMECKRKQLKGFDRGFWYIFYKKLCGYGEIPFNVIFTSIFLIIMFSFFYLFGGIESVGSSILKESPNLIKYNLSLDFVDIQWAIRNIDLIYEDFLVCLYTSIITFTTLGYGDVHPIGWSRLIASVEAGFGIIMTALFIFVFTRKMLR